MIRYEYHINLFYHKSSISIFGPNPKDKRLGGGLFRCVRSLNAVPKAIMKATGLRLEQINLRLLPKDVGYISLGDPKIFRS